MKIDYSLTHKATRANRRQISALFAVLLSLSATAIPLHGATAPPATLIYSDPISAPIHGGMATIGSSGASYFSALSTSASTAAKVIKLNVSGTVQWTFTAPGNGPNYDMYAVPSLDAAGAKLYIGSDEGKFYCLNTSDGSVAWNFPVTTGTDKRIRSSAALDPNNPAGPTVYFHCNNGYLYALDANTGATRWQNPAHTFNEGGPTANPNADPPYTQPLSSSPVVAADGSVYVGSKNGHVYRFNASNGAQLMDKTIGGEIEAPLVIGNNGWVYGATRSLNGVALAFAINPVTSIIVWQVSVPTNDGSLGVIVSPVIDQSGFVYVVDFGHKVTQFDGATGASPRSWTTEGKLCQAPTLLQNGLILIGESFPPDPALSKLTAFNIYGADNGPPVWTSTGTVGAPMVGGLFGATAVRCTGTSYIFIADSSGHVYRLTGTDPMMAGQWPTLQCGNRRAGKSITYPAAITVLTPFAGSQYSLTAVNGLDPVGRVAGQSYGNYRYSCGDSVSVNSSAAVWQNQGILNPGGCLNAQANTTAVALNGAGDTCGYNSSTVQPLAWPDVPDGTTTVTLSLAASDLTTYTSGYTSDINSGSQIIGYGFNGSTVHALRWDKSSPTTWAQPANLNAPAGGQAYAFSITVNGFVAGKATFAAGGPFHAFKTSFAPTDLFVEAEDLGTMGGTASEAWDYDELKGTVGRSQIQIGGYWRGFFLPIDCPTLGGLTTYEIPALTGVAHTDPYSSAAYGLNKNGQVVGYTQIQQGQSWVNRAFIYSPQTGLITDLNTYPLDGGQTPAGLGWTLTSARAINDAGVIVGYGNNALGPTCWIIYPKCQD